ncbi:hypothetical protein ACKU27_12180 [Sphingobium yanoikuyae]|uniref:hypothetical protein n=1 Tax=Sphingobium yanoikuyae TaxID=13690 RepID=UPI003B8F26E8
MTDIIQELRGLIAKGVPESDSGWYISNTTGSGLSIIEDGLMFPGSGICPIKCEAPQAALIVAAINHLPALLDRLEAAERVAIAARDYASNYLLDEREDPSLCFDDAQHPKLIALFDALDAPAIREVKP